MPEEQPQNQKPLLRPLDILDSMDSEAPVLIGFSKRGKIGEPFEIKRWGQFIVNFGSFKKCGYLATSVKGFFLNGGKRLFILNLGERPEKIEDVVDIFKSGLKALDEMDHIPFIAAPGEHEPSVHSAILEYCEKKGTHALLDGPEELIEKIKEAQEDEDTNEEAEPVEDEKEEILDEISEIDIDDEEKYENMPQISSSQGIVIYPWIHLRDRVLGDFFIPPSGHVAGILSRLFADEERPDYSDLKGTVYLRYKFSPEEIEQYEPRGISFLRYPTKLPGLILS